MSATEKEIFGCVGVLFSSILGIVASVIWSGFVLSQLWVWFIVPVFHAPQLTIPIAIGISMTVSYLTRQLDTAKDKEKNEWWEVIVLALAYPTITLILGWTVHLFVTIPT